MKLIDPYKITFTENLDSKKKGKVAYYDVDKIVDTTKKSLKYIKGELLFDHLNEHLLDDKNYKRLLKKYPITESLYNSLMHLFNNKYGSSIAWYKEILATTKSFDFVRQIEDYEKFIRKKYSCPILKEIDPNNINNVNYLAHFEYSLRLAEANNISSVNQLFYGVKKPDFKKHRPNQLAVEAYNIISNIVYFKFLNFLQSQKQSNENKKKRLKQKSGPFSLTTKWSILKLKNLHKTLVDRHYIYDTSFNSFKKCLSGLEIAPPDQRIKWGKSKSKGYYLFKNICDDFSIILLNKSVFIKGKKFDSNDNPRHGYKEIDDLI